MPANSLALIMTKRFWLVSKKRWVLCSGIINGLWVLTVGSQSPPLLHLHPTQPSTNSAVFGSGLSLLLFRLLCGLFPVNSLGWAEPSHFTSVYLTAVSYSVCHCRHSGCVGFSITSHLSFCCPQTSQSAATYDSRQTTQIISATANRWSGFQRTLSCLPSFNQDMFSYHIIVSFLAYELLTFLVS